MSLKYKLNTLPEANTELNQRKNLSTPRNRSLMREKKRMALLGKMSKMCDSDVQEESQKCSSALCNCETNEF